MSVAFKFTKNRQKGYFRKDSPTKPEREKVIWKLFNRCFKNFHNGKQFIIIKILQKPVK